MASKLLKHTNIHPDVREVCAPQYVTDAEGNPSANLTCAKVKSLFGRAIHRVKVVDENGQTVMSEKGNPKTTQDRGPLVSTRDDIVFVCVPLGYNPQDKRTASNPVNIAARDALRDAFRGSTTGLALDEVADLLAQSLQVGHGVHDGYAPRVEHQKAIVRSMTVDALDALANNARRRQKVRRSRKNSPVNTYKVRPGKRDPWRARKVSD